MNEPKVYEPSKPKTDHSAGIRWRRRILTVVGFETVLALVLGWLWLSWYENEGIRVRSVGILLYVLTIGAAIVFLAIVGVVVRRATFDWGRRARIGAGVAVATVPLVALVPLLMSGMWTPIAECAPWSLPSNDTYERVLRPPSAAMLPDATHIRSLDELLARVGATRDDVTHLERGYVRVDTPDGVPIYFREPGITRVGIVLPNRVLEELPVWWGPADEAVTWGPRTGDFTLTWPGVQIEVDPVCRGRWLLVKSDGGASVFSLQEEPPGT